MDWRETIEQLRPTAPVAPPSRHTPLRIAPRVDFLRDAGQDPEQLELAVRARSYTEQLRREGYRL